MRNTWGGLLVASLGLWMAGCPTTTHTLTVRVQSGLRAGFEIRYVEARLYRGSVPCSTDEATLRSAGRALDVGPYTAGEPVLLALSLGPLVRGELFALDASVEDGEPAVLVEGTGTADPPTRGGSTSVMMQGPTGGSSLRVAELLTYDRRLSEADRQRVIDYLVDRYGLGS